MDFWNYLKTSKREPNFTEADDGKEHIKKSSTIYWNRKKVEDILPIHQEEPFLLGDLIDQNVFYWKNQFLKKEKLLGQLN